jgi:hypothetical protein
MITPGQCLKLINETDSLTDYGKYPSTKVVGFVLLGQILEEFTIVLQKKFW